MDTQDPQPAQPYTIEPADPKDFLTGEEVVDYEDKDFGSESGLIHRPTPRDLFPRGVVSPVTVAAAPTRPVTVAAAPARPVPVPAAPARSAPAGQAVVADVPPAAPSAAASSGAAGEKGKVGGTSDKEEKKEAKAEKKAAKRAEPELPTSDKKPKHFPDRFANRELSWLAFNKRVLEQAADHDLPLLERAWFLTIFSSNLDEFYMVRVAGLKRRIATNIATPTHGVSPRQQLDAITERAQALTAEHAELYHSDIKPALAREGIVLTSIDQLDATEHERLQLYFRKQVFPVLTPLAVDPSHPFPYISGLSLNLAVILRNPRSGKEHFARVKVPQSLPRFVEVDPAHLLRGEDAALEVRESGAVPLEEQVAFVPLEQLIAAHLDHLFPGMEIVEHHAFRVTRNEDVEVEEDDAENLLTAMEKELMRRRFGPAVRLEVEDTISPYVRSFLVSRLGIRPEDTFVLPAPLDRRGLNQIHDLDIARLKYQPYVPVTPKGIAPVESARPGDVFAAIRERDVLLHHPYDSFATSVQHFIATAAADPKVLAIKQTLYRTSGDSPIVDALIEAARAGKQVVAIVEIKARFDEEANISWARKLERAGVHVVYGMVGLKTHCKLSLVVRHEGEVLRRYCHVGTGNYHPKTARGYEDLGLLTCDTDVAQDLTRLFNQLSGYAPRAKFHRLLVAPLSVRPGLVERIDREIANKKAGLLAWIRIKVNSVVDEVVIDALYRASQAGVPVEVVVRGICAIRAGIPGLSENIRVRSILGRYLEHSRIYAFANGGETEVWIGSADLMHRNLDRRVEALVRITEPGQVKYLAGLVKREAADTTASWHLEADGTWKRHSRDAKGKPLDDIQVLLMENARKRVSAKR
ncbi:RNA degradosome polyphosphate kinase [Buchananella felis]|uniref:RNA degradosome polyphosphate kinase n=1 Tax=Buchananella felis TaxID=3231492 RepID=UPI0035273C1D